MTAVPNFALRVLLRSWHQPRGDDPSRSFDFTRWKALIVGAERLDPVAMAEVATSFEPYGFDPRALKPAYGLSEATLAVTGAAAGFEATAVSVELASRIGARVVIRRREPVAGDPTRFSDRNWLVSCGKPLEGVDLAIIDDAGITLPPQHMGEIAVSGPSVAAGTGGASVTSLCNSALHTGDLGFLSDGELFVVGRREDRVEAGHGLVHVDDLEATLCRIPNGENGSFVCLVDPITHARVILVAERPDPEWLRQAERVLRGHLGHEIAVQIVIGGPGTILRTTSGKPRRQRMWDEFTALRDGSEVGVAAEQ